MTATSPADPTPRRRGRGWRLLRRSAIGLVAFVVALTLASLAYNAATTPPARLSAPDGADVTIDGARVHYKTWGSQGPVLVLIGGFVEATAAWEQTAPLLARDHRVYAVDLPGYGYSDYSGRYSLADETALVLGLLDALQLERPALVGHSLGAAVVGSLALQYPERIRGVVFADGDALPFGDPDQPSRPRGGPDWLGLPWSTSAFRLVTRTPALYEPILRRVCGSRCRGFSPAAADAWLRPLRQGDAERALRAQSGAGMLALTNAQVRAITVPRAIIWGAEDRSGGGSLDATRANLGRPAERILDGAGHLTMLADPDGFAAVVSALTVGWR